MNGFWGITASKGTALVFDFPLTAALPRSQDDANNDPQWSREQIIAAKFCFAGLDIGQTEVDIMDRTTQAIFEILEKSWSTQNCTLVDMKVQRKPARLDGSRVTERRSC